MKMRFFFLLLIISTSALAYIQPTTLCGYSPEGSILDIDPSIIIAYDTTDKKIYNFTTSRVVIYTDNKLNINSICVLGLGISKGTKVTELGIAMPCAAKEIFEVIGMPSEINNERYVYKYDIGKKSYILSLTKDKENSDSIESILLFSFQSISYLNLCFDTWIKQTKAYNSGN